MSWQRRLVNALIADGMHNQDIHTLINYERRTVNLGRIAGVKQNADLRHLPYPLTIQCLPRVSLSVTSAHYSDRSLEHLTQ